MTYWMTALLTLGLAGIAGADDVQLTNGGSLEGIARSESGRWILRTHLGDIALPEADVKSVAPGRTLLHDYDDRITALVCGCPTASQVFELALWAKQQGLTRYVNGLLAMTLECDPDHQEARCMLGFSMHEGRWVTVRGRDALRAAAEPMPLMGALPRPAPVRARRTRSLETTPYTLGIPLTQARPVRNDRSSGGYSIWQGVLPARNFLDLPPVLRRDSR